MTGASELPSRIELVVFMGFPVNQSSMVRSGGRTKSYHVWFPSRKLVLNPFLRTESGFNKDSAIISVQRTVSMLTR